jgi:hypothetical protein
LISLAAQLPRRERLKQNHSFYLLDGARPGSPAAKLWERLVQDFEIDIKLTAVAQLGDTIRQIAQLVDDRLAGGELSGPPVFLFVYQLSRLRELRKSDEFSFSSMSDGEAPSLDKLFANILREGPAVGVHSLVWCDSYKNLSRWMDRQSLRDLDLRVLQQMSATDSSNLMDTPAASRLGVHRALAYDEERGQSEKFRPYGFPSDAWLDTVRHDLRKQHVAQ